MRKRAHQNRRRKRKLLIKKHNVLLQNSGNASHGTNSESTLINSSLYMIILQAIDALNYLTNREDFWNQIDAGKHGGIKNGGCMFGGKVCESLRFQM